MYFKMDHIAQTLPLEGGCNFRDLGGYRTGGGRAIRGGQLFRSGVMAYLTPGDHHLLSRIGIRAVCDLRWPDERSREPTRWLNSADAPQVLRWSDVHGEAAARRLSGKKSAAETRAAVIDFYHGMHQWMRPRLRGLFDCLTTGDMPVVFHCSAGKDRTGLAAALVLSALGVPREAILIDYALTNKIDLEQFIRSRRRSMLGLGNPSYPLLTMPEEARKVLLAADTEYLLAGFAGIEKTYGSIDGYLQVELGVTARERDRMRDALLLDCPVEA